MCNFLLLKIILTNQSDHHSERMSKWYKKEHKHEIQVAYKQIKNVHSYSYYKKCRLKPHQMTRLWKIPKSGSIPCR